MFDMFESFLSMFLELFKIPLFFFGSIFVLVGFLCLFYFFMYRFKGKRLKKGSRVILRKRGVFKKILLDFPRRFVLDIYNREPDFFRYQGLHLFCGEQGSGKTIAMVEMIRRMQEEYPQSRCITNFAYAFEDDVLKNWRGLIDYKNGFKGVICGIDELQNWFSSNDSRNFPPQMLEIVTQNRKNRRVICGTSQVFTRLAKPLREQATLVYLPLTFFGCLTIVRVKKPVLTSDGELKEYKKRGWYFFIHDEELRNSYDTYKVIERLSKSGFSENKSMETNIYSVNNVVVPKKFGK